MNDIKNILKSRYTGIVDAFQTKQGLTAIVKSPKTANEIAIDFMRAGLKNTKVETPNGSNPYIINYIITGMK